MIFKLEYINKDNKDIKSILDKKIFINRDLFFENNRLKSEIDDIPYYNWKIIRSICADYEIVGNNKVYNNNMTKNINSISRAYFKLLEILNINENNFNIKNKEKLNISCLCEAPGGFIKCLYDYRNNQNDIYKTISLKDYKDNKIDYNINNINNLEIIYGDNNKNNDGNIFNPEIINSYIKKHKSKVDIVTADGGMLLKDYQENYKSNFHIQLFISELYISMKILKTEGIFILKCYDLSSKVMIDFLIILNNIFKNVKIYKPKSSREMNNEKYIICNNLKENINYIEEKLWEIINNLWNNPDIILLNILSYKTIINYKYLINIFKRIDYNNLSVQYERLRYAISLKYLNNYDLKQILKKRKKEHYKYAYKWFKLNNIKI